MIKFLGVVVTLEHAQTVMRGLSVTAPIVAGLWFIGAGVEAVTHTHIGAPTGAAGAHFLRVVTGSVVVLMVVMLLCILHEIGSVGRDDADERRTADEP